MGKLVGLLIGGGIALAAGSRWGLLLPLLGLVLGHVVDAALGFTDPDDPALHDRGASREELDREARATFSRFLAALFVRVAEADGELTRAEAAAIRDFFERFGFEPDELQHVRAALQEARRSPEPLPRALAATREALDPAERSLLLHALVELAHTHGEVERRLLQEIAEGLELDPDVVEAMLGAEAGPVPDGDPYRALGLDAQATDAQVKQAYRALAQTLHPDKVAHLGPQASARAGEAFAQVNLAYEEIRKRRRL